MTTLAIGQSATVKLLDDGTFTVATNGGMGNVNVVTNLGITRNVGFGPTPLRRVFGPYKEGATVTVFNQSCDSLDYDGYLALVDGGGNSAYPPNMFWKGSLAKIAAARSRTGLPPRYLIGGDSNVVGQGAGGGAQGLLNARETSWPVVMGKALGWQIGSFFGDQNVTSLGGYTLPTYDPRVTLGTGWSLAGAANTFGGRFILATGVSAGRLGFSHPQTTDRIRVWYPTATNGNTAITVYCDGAIVGVINANAAAGFTSQTFTVPRGVHLFEIKSDGATNVSYINGIETWDSTSTAPILVHAGWCGGKMSDLNDSTNPFSYRSAMVAMGLDAVLLHCTINDILQATTIATISSGIDGFNYQASLSGADVLNTVSFPFNDAGTIDGTLDKIAAFLRSNASAYNGAFADARAVYGSSYLLANTRGLAFNDYHPNPAGHSLTAGMFAKMFQ